MEQVNFSGGGVIMLPFLVNIYNLLKSRSQKKSLRME